MTREERRERIARAKAAQPQFRKMVEQRLRRPLRLVSPAAAVPKAPPLQSHNGHK